MPGTSGTDASSATGGLFTDQGYEPGSGLAGQPGGTGHNGKPGAPGYTKQGCYSSSDCSGGMGPCANHFCGNLGTVVSVTTEAGRCGCGGAGGPSHAVVLIGGAKMSQDADSVLAVQAGGPGGGSSPAGASSKVFED